MSYILFSDGVRVGEISEWVLTERPPEKKVVLGKEILTQKPKDQCQFISPKPVTRKNQLWLIASKSESSGESGSAPEGKSGREKMILGEVQVRHGTQITATVESRAEL